MSEQIEAYEKEYKRLTRQKLGLKLSFVATAVLIIYYLVIGLFGLALNVFFVFIPLVVILRLNQKRFKSLAERKPI